MVNIYGDNEPRQLTKSGFYHDITMDTVVKLHSPAINYCYILCVSLIQNFKYFVSVFSNISSSVRVAIHSLIEPCQIVSEWSGPGA